MTVNEMTLTDDDCGQNTIAVAQDPGRDQIWYGGELIHSGGLAWVGFSSMNSASKSPDYSSVLEKVGEEEDGSFLNTG